MIEGYRLSPQQKRLWFLQRSNSLFRVEVDIRMDGPLNLIYLEQALDRLHERHEILRTAFESLPGMDLPIQVVNNSSSYSLVESTSIIPEEKKQLFACVTRPLLQKHNDDCCYRDPIKIV